MRLRSDSTDRTAPLPTPYRQQRIGIQLDDAHIVEVIDFGIDWRGRYVTVKSTGIDGESHVRKLRKHDRVAYSLHLNGNL